MQTLHVKSKGLDGSEIKKTVKVKRSWQSISGLQVFLHADGTYGFKDGAPVRSENDLKQVITDQIQLEAALGWWNRTGKKQSEAYYTALEKRKRQLAGDFSETAADTSSELDLILYYRRPVDGDPEEGVAPQTWMEMGFTKRPDWWGRATSISFDDWVYERAGDADVKEDAIPEIDQGQKQLANMTLAFLQAHEVTVRHLDEELYKEFGPLRITKTTKKYAQAETVSDGTESEPVVFTGDGGPHAKIPIENLMLVSVDPIAEKEDGDNAAKDPITTTPGEF